MTAQIAETLHYEGQQLSMCTEPLGDYFALGGVNPGFESNSTALWRGYVGTWEILDGRLYLIELHGTLEGGGEASVGTLFPDFPDRVFAHWYSVSLQPDASDAAVDAAVETIKQDDAPVALTVKNSSKILFATKS